MSYIEYVDTADFYSERAVSTAPLPSMHSHGSYEIYYLAKGEREYFIEDRFFMVEEGDMVLIPRRVLHRTAGEGGLRYLVHFSEKFLKNFFTETTVKALLKKEPVVFRGDSRDKEQIQSIMDTILTEYTRAEKENLPQNETLLSGYVYQLLFLFANGQNYYVPGHGDNDRITGIIQYINENYNHITDIEQIAEKFYISKFHLCRTFRKHLGVPLVAYLNTIKIREACNMMRKGSADMTQIAMDCGFNSPSYFCKVFKKERGISPSEYRRKHSTKN